MKLKKIASLALAGVMAVSMLAGCSTNNTNDDKKEPDAPATGVSAEVGALVKDAPKYVTFADSSKLDSALDYAMQWAGVRFILDNYVNKTDLQDVTEPELTDALKSKLNIGTDVDVKNLEDIGAIKVDTDGKGAVAYELYAVSGIIGKDAVEQKIANELANVVKDYKAYDKDNGDNWYYDYTVSVSIDSKTSNSAGVGNVNGGIHGSVTDVDLGGFGSIVSGAINGGIHGDSTSAENPTVTFVAVQVVRTARAQD